MKNRIVLGILILFFVLSFILPSFAEARRGCCSHHGGVCGCSCCDGTPLSAKCAPYYPHCYDRTPTYKQEVQSTSLQNNEVKKESSQVDKKEVIYVGSANSNKYHYTWCRWAKRISPRNLVTFSSVADAKSKGNVPCKVCRPPEKDK